MRWSNASVGVSTRRAATPTPALLTRMSRPPRRSTVAATDASTAASSAASAGTNHALPSRPARRRSWASCPSASSRPVITTPAPPSRSRAAMANPRPVVPPVTRAARSSDPAIARLPLVRGPPAVPPVGPSLGLWHDGGRVRTEPTPPAMNILDVALLIWACFAAVSGYRRGAALQLTEYAGLLVGLLVGAIFAPPLARLFTSPVIQAVVALGVLIGLAAIGEGFGWLVGRRIWAAARRSVLGPLDAGAGSVVSVIAVLLVTWFLSYSLSAGPFPSLSRQIGSSAVVNALDDVLPRPPSLLAEVRGFLDRFGFPEVFADDPPLPAGPVQGPSSALVATISAKANPSVVQIVSQACGAIRSGSGFIVAGHDVVTNAHVVAGASDPHVRIHGKPYAA